MGALKRLYADLIFGPFNLSPFYILECLYCEMNMRTEAVNVGHVLEGVAL